MRVTQTEKNNNCPYCCNQEQWQGFQEIGNLKDTGWIIYRHTDHTTYVNRYGKTCTSVKEDVFLLSNKKRKPVSADLLQLDKNEIPCPRCRQKLEHAQKLINKKPFSDATDVVAVCDHCLLRTRTQEPCSKCIKIVDHFLSTSKVEQKKTTKEYVDPWLTKMKNILNENISGVTSNKKTQRSYSEINIPLRSHNTSTSSTKCRVQDMFHSEVNVMDNNRIKQEKQPRKQVAKLEKEVNFKEVIETFQTKSDGAVEIMKNKQERFGISSGYYDLKPYASTILGKDKHIDLGGVKSLPFQNETKQIDDKIEGHLNKYKESIPYETEDHDLEKQAGKLYKEKHIGAGSVKILPPQSETKQITTRRDEHWNKYKESIPYETEDHDLEKQAATLHEEKHYGTGSVKILPPQSEAKQITARRDEYWNKYKESIPYETEDHDLDKLAVTLYKEKHISTQITGRRDEHWNKYKESIPYKTEDHDLDKQAGTLYKEKHISAGGVKIFPPQSETKQITGRRDEHWNKYEESIPYKTEDHELDKQAVTLYKEKHIGAGGVKILPPQSETKQITAKRDDHWTKHKESIPYEPEDHDLEIQASFTFPQEPKKAGTKLKIITSSQLIRDTHEKLLLKAEEEENKKREEQKRKAEEERQKKLAREENKKLQLKKVEKISEEGVTKKPGETTTKTDKSRQDEMIKQTRATEQSKLQKDSLGKQETAEVKEKDKLDKISKLKDLKEGEKFVPSKEEAKLGKHTDDPKKKELKTIEAKQVPHINAKNEKELKISDLKQLAKEKKNMEQDAIKAKRLEGINVESGVHKKSEGRSKPVTNDDVTRDTVLAIDKSKSVKSKAEETKEEFGDHQKKHDIIQPKDKNIAPKSTKVDESNVKDVKISQIKLSKASTDNLNKQMVKVDKQEPTKKPMESDIPMISKLLLETIKTKKRDALQQKEEDKSIKPTKVEESIAKELKMDQIKLETATTQKLTYAVKQRDLEKKIETNVPELSKLLLESTEKKEPFAKKLPSVKESKKKEDTSVQEPKEKDLKINQVKLTTSSTDNLICTVKKTQPEKNKKTNLPELSKLLLESADKKEKFADKFSSSKVPEKKDEKSELPSKGPEERVLKMKEVKLVERDVDDVILQLIRIRPEKPIVREKAPVPDIVQMIKKKKKHKREQTKSKLTQVDAEESDITEDLSQELTVDMPIEPVPLRPPQREGQEITPLYVQHELSEISSTAPLKVKDARAEDQKKIDPEAVKGVIRYALSDRTFIEKGWTMLPVEKVVRKMNVYRMRPAQPEFDWFERNKNKGLISYDSGEKLAEVDKNGRGRWFYKNGRLALDYYEAEETNTQQRFVLYSNGEPDERGRPQPITILATFDHLGNGVVFDHAGKIRLKYNQTEGVLLDRSIGPVTNWKWHALNDPPVLQQVMIDTQMPVKDPNILKMGGPADKKPRADNEEMLAIEFDNFIKEKSKKLTQKFKPFQIKMKALKINNHFSLKVLDQATIYLIFRDGSANLKLNIGMILDHKEIVDTDTAELGEVSNSIERLPARTDSLAALQRSVAYAQRYERMRIERDRKLRRPEPCLSIDNLGKAASRALRPPLRTLPPHPTRAQTSCSEPNQTEYCKCSRKQSSRLYYNTRLL